MNDEVKIGYNDQKGRKVTLCQGIALIHTKHHDGTPALVTMIRPTDTVDLAGGEEFMIFWAEEKMIRRPN